jgi:YegS/Rv2252/BmrU family lipid kinase
METNASRPLFIVNPMSGGGRTGKRWPALEAAIRHRDIEPDAVFTAHRGHGYDLANAGIADGRETIIAVGGDGTVNEVASAILDAGAGDRVRIGTIAMGTGKDVGKCLGIGEPVKAICAIAAGNERRIDAARVESHGENGNPITRYFVLEASAGWIPEISRNVPRLLKLLGDTAPYTIMTFVKMLGPMNRDFDVTIDGETFHARYNSVSVHNMELWGGDLLAVPGALPDDGVFDVIRWGALGRLAVLKAVQGQRHGGTHLQMKGVDHHPAHVVELSSPKRSPIDLDGEPGGYLPARFEVLPGALRFLAPLAT